MVLVQSPGEVRSLLVLHKLIHLLLVMLAPQIDVARRTVGALGKTYMRPGATGSGQYKLSSPQDFEIRKYTMI